MARERLDRERWTDAALLAIGRGGTPAVNVAALAKSLGATKGSFYWHFRDREELIAEALAAWEREGTDAAIEALSGVADGAERLRLVMEFALDPRDEQRGPLDTALFASRDPVAGPVVTRVWQKRMAFLERCFRDLGHPRGEARHRARLAFGAYLTWLHELALPAAAVPGARERRAYIRAVLARLV